MEARRHDGAGQRALFGEALPDRRQHRHVGVGPCNALVTEIGETEIGDVVISGGGGHCVLLVLLV
jgi:hypothetical protein